MKLTLIRTEGKTFTKGPSLTTDRLVKTPVLERASKSDVARETEAAFDLGDCLYFYAGHACPAFGDVVLAYDMNMTEGYRGNATPFDTGGLHLGLVRARTIDGGVDPIHYCRDHIVDLPSWRLKAVEYVQQYFTSCAAYTRGERPLRDDPTGRLHHPANERRAWTWEVRIWNDHPIDRDLRKIWISRDHLEEVRLALLAPSGSASIVCAKLLADGMFVPVPTGEPLHDIAEGEIATWI